MQNSTVLLIIGLLSIIAGILALTNPFSASLAVEQLAGWAFLILGILQAYVAFRAHGHGGRLWAMLLGLIAIVIGVALLARPMAGLVALTYILAIMFLVSGVFKLIAGFAIPLPALKWWLVLSGAVSLLLGIMILANFPQSAATILGLLLGIELLSNGVAATVFALSRNSGTPNG